jgi:hypothetical protein
MSITGRRTRAMFDRYNINSQEDQRTALQQTTAYVTALPAEDDNVADQTPPKEAASWNTDKTLTVAVQKETGGPTETSGRPSDSVCGGMQPPILAALDGGRLAGRWQQSGAKIPPGRDRLLLLGRPCPNPTVSATPALRRGDSSTSSAGG